MVQAKRLSWIEALLDHVAGGNDECNRDDSAHWLGYNLGKRYDGSFTHFTSLGLPIVQCLDAASTLAMWSDANINCTQQRMLKKHLWLHLGKHLFLMDAAIEDDNDHYSIPTSYGEYK
jgi:hypothetical protein